MRGGLLLDENLALEVDAVAEFHELVGVARIAVFAGEFAPAIRINSPGKWEIARANDTAKQGAGLKSEVFNIVTFADGFSIGSQARDADQLGLGGGIGEEGQGRHVGTFAICSPTINEGGGDCQPEVGSRERTPKKPWKKGKLIKWDYSTITVECRN